MEANEPVEQARSVLAEVTELMRTPNPQNLEKALSPLRDTRNRLLSLTVHGRSGCRDLARTLNDLLRLAEQAAAFYLGLAAAVVSHSGSYTRSGEAALPAACQRRLSVDG